MLEPVTMAALEDVPLRLAFSHESQNFTRWLQTNLHRLSAAIGAPLRLAEGKAVGGGRFADLLAYDERDGSLVVIENQLEAADDAHLGQILTYLAASDARTAVWVAERFSKSLLSAVRMLNAIAPLKFFAVQVRLVRIGGSDIASVFDVLERPSRYERSVDGGAGRLSPERLEGFARGFWAAHLERHPEDGRQSRIVGERCRWRPTQPTGVVIGQLVQENRASVFLRGRRGVTLATVVEALAPFADRLERRLGVPLRGDDKAFLAATSQATDLTDPAHWAAASDFLAATATLYDQALRGLSRVAPATIRRSHS